MPTSHCLPSPFDLPPLVSVCRVVVVKGIVLIWHGSVICFVGLYSTPFVYGRRALVTRDEARRCPTTLVQDVGHLLNTAFFGAALLAAARSNIIQQLDLVHTVFK